MNRTVRAGFVPLVDAAVLVAAREVGFAGEEGIDLQLVRQPSWAVLRDHLNLGYLDCAHALAPLPIAASLGIGQVCASLFAPFVLGRGGNAITLRSSLCAALREAAGGPVGSVDAWGRALARHVKGRTEPLTLAMVYPFSGHNFELRYWLAASGLHPDRDIRIVAIPPPLMVESLKAGHVDGFCVGEPWNSLAREHGLGEIVATKSQMFPGGVEKVLAVADALIDDRSLLDSLLPALLRAAEWCDDPGNRDALAQILARDEYLGIDTALLARSLSGDLDVASGTGTADPDFICFYRSGANRPRAEDALWLYAQMLRWGQIDAVPGDEATAAGVFRSDVYDAVLGGADSRMHARMTAYDGVSFDGRSITSYLESFSLFTPFGTTVAELQT